MSKAGQKNEVLVRTRSFMSYPKGSVCREQRLKDASATKQPTFYLLASDQKAKKDKGLALHENGSSINNIVILLTAMTLAGIVSHPTDCQIWHG